MPFIVTSVHDPIALAETCRHLGLPRPHQDCILVEGRQASGWVIRLPGLYSPIVCDTLTGLVAYHPRDNAFVPYARTMRFILRYYDVRAQGRHEVVPSAARLTGVLKTRRRPRLAQAA